MQDDGGGRDVAARFRRAVADGALDLPLPGGGRTPERFEALVALARNDLSLARLGEGHADALAILAEAGRRPGAGAYGVWAASSRHARLDAEPAGKGWCLSGRKPFCSGATSVRRALVTAFAEGSQLLLDVEVANAVRPVEGSWPAVGMADSDSRTVAFDLVVDADAQVGPPGFYVERPGFWHGAVGVAACWYGGASRLVDDTIGYMKESGSEAHALAHLGTAVATATAMRATLAWAAAEFDADPADKDGNARRVAATVREVVHSGCVEVMTRTAAAAGARLLCHDGGHGRAAADLWVYLSQYHGGRDAADIGRAALQPPPPGAGGHRRGW
ncbi:MAG TPA: acyl-CoA dehydrogenase family protein [Acidimicrobiales bacterium]|nr:acyl-CoA dehydrogenase family protein [Acidimicrobiales bacterium]